MNLKNGVTVEEKAEAPGADEQAPRDADDAGEWSLEEIAGDAPEDADVQPAETADDAPAEREADIDALPEYDGAPTTDAAAE